MHEELLNSYNKFRDVSNIIKELSNYNNFFLSGTFPTSKNFKSRFFIFYFLKFQQ